jgi:hypothetical protein
LHPKWALVEAFLEVQPHSAIVDAQLFAIVSIPLAWHHRFHDLTVIKGQEAIAEV